MNIGVLTYHCVPNFGAQLQAISTIGYLKAKGFTPYILNWIPNDLEDMYKKRIPEDQFREHIRFASQYMPLSKLCRTETDIISEVKKLKIDAIITGSDALFKYIPQVCRNDTKPLSVEDLEGNAFWGKFLSNLSVKAIAFSVSCQNTQYQKINSTEKTQLKQNLAHYSKISVRDEWTKKMVEKITKRKDVFTSPDPVFAFNKNCYLEIPTKEEIQQKFNLPSKYILFSFRTNHLPNEYICQLSTSFVEQGITPVALPMPECLKKYNIERLITQPLSPLDWYAIIKYSLGYVGERMHPIVVALHNSIPFFSFDEYGFFKTYFFNHFKKYIATSSKTFQLLDKAGLKEYYYSYNNPKTKLPSISTIINQIKNFPISRCTQFAKNSENNYLDAMNYMLNELVN